MWLSEKAKKNIDSFIVIFISFIIVFLPSALRYGVGTDFFGYLEIYKDLTDNITIEYGFYYINSVLKLLDADFQWVIIILAFIYTIVLFVGLPYKNRWIIFLTFMLLLYLNSFNTIRQAISIVFAIWALRFYINNKILWFTLLLFVGSLFHQSILILIPLGYVALVPTPKFFTNYILPIILVSFSILIYFKSNVLFQIFEFILNTIGMEKYGLYFSNIAHFSTKEFGTNLGIIGKILFSIYFICMSKHIVNENPRYLFLIYLIFAYVISLILSTKIVIFDRMQLVFIVALIYSVYILWNIEVYKKLNKLIVNLFLLFLWLAFIKTSFGIPTIYGDPMINPYKSILEK